MFRDITIHAVMNGFVVQVGCQTLVYDNVGALVSDLQMYLVDPVKTEKWIRERSCNTKWTLTNEAGVADPTLNRLTVEEIERRDFEQRLSARESQNTAPALIGHSLPTMGR